MFSSTEACGSRDLVIVYLHPEKVRPGDGQCHIKRLVMAPPPYVTFPWQESPKSDVHALVVFDQLSTPAKQYTCRCEDVLGIHKCLGTVPEHLQAVFLKGEHDKHSEAS